jgi:hypothetical protein
MSDTSLDNADGRVRGTDSRVRGTDGRFKKAGRPCQGAVVPGRPSTLTAPPRIRACRRA